MRDEQIDEDHRGDEAVEPEEEGLEGRVGVVRLVRRRVRRDGLEVKLSEESPTRGGRGRKR